MKGSTIYGRAFEQFINSSRKALKYGMSWHDHVFSSVHNINESLVDWVTEHKKKIIYRIAFIVFIAVCILFFLDLKTGNIKDAARVGIGGLIGTPILGIIIGLASALIIYLSLWLIDKIILLLIYIVLFTPILIGAIFYALYLILIVTIQFILLLPLSVFFILNSIWLLWRHIFYTCPNIECSFRRAGIYRGLPIHLCPDCSERHERLWPNTHGLLHHPCNCGRKLPTLDLLGRSKLTRRCAVCMTELPNKKLPEKLIALVGGPAVGKTAFLLTSTEKLLYSNSKKVKAEIAVPRQKDDLEQEIRNLKKGIPPVKTNASVRDAYQFWLALDTKRFSLYYYDAPGEEFSSIDRYGRHENVKHLDGIILLVDPFSLKGLKHEVSKETVGLSVSTTPLEDVVASMIAAVHRMQTNKQINLAIVINKADTMAVKKRLGAITPSTPTSDTCRNALIQWGEANSIRLLEQNFNNISYFACSALGRSPAPDNSDPFRPSGVIKPLLWILTR